MCHHSSQAAGQDFPTPTRVYTALATIPLPPPPQCLWAELRPSMLQQALPTDTLVSPLSNTHLLDTAFRLSRQPEVFTAWQPAIFALRTSESVETLVGRHSQLLGMYELMQWLSILAPETEGANPCNPLVVRSLQTGTLDIILQLLLLPGNMVETSGSCLDGPARAAEQQHQQQQQPQAQEPAQPGQPKQSEQLEQPRLEQAAEQQQEQPVVWMWPEGLAGITVQPGAAALLLMSALHDPQLQSRLQPACGAGGDSSGSGSGGSGIAGSGSAGSGSAGSGESSSGGGSAGQAATTEAAELQATCVATQAARAVSRANGCLMFYPYLSEVVGALALCAPGPDDDGAGAGVGTVGGGGAQASSSGADGPSSDAQAAADGASCPVAMQGPGGCGNAACTYCQALLRPNAIDIRRVALPPGARARLPALAARLPVAARVVPDSGYVRRSGGGGWARQGTKGGVWVGNGEWRVWLARPLGAKDCPGAFASRRLAQCPHRLQRRPPRPLTSLPPLHVAVAVRAQVGAKCGLGGARVRSRRRRTSRRQRCWYARLRLRLRSHCVGRRSAAGRGSCGLSTAAHGNRAGGVCGWVRGCVWVRGRVTRVSAFPCG